MFTDFCEGYVDAEEYVTTYKGKHYNGEACVAYQIVGNASDDFYVKELKELNDSIKETHQSGLSITGGYCRDLLMGIKPSTDIDIISIDRTAIKEKVLEKFPLVEKEENNYRIPNNTMHIIDDGRTRCIDGKLYTVVYKDTFDFTVNLGCISLNDGNILASPITMFDIKHRILRLTTIPSNIYNSGNGSVDLYMMLRAIKFSLKYGMKIHTVILQGMNFINMVQEKLGKTDEAAVYHCLKHFDIEPEEFRKQYYEALRYINFIDTDKYHNFNDYFKFIKDRYNSGSYNQLPIYRSIGNY